MVPVRISASGPDSGALGTSTLPNDYVVGTSLTVSVDGVNSLNYGASAIYIITLSAPAPVSVTLNVFITGKAR